MQYYTFALFCLIFAFSFFGKYSNLADLLSNFYMQFLIAGAVFTAHYIYYKSYKAMAAALVVFLISAGVIIHAFWPASPLPGNGKQFKIVQFNVNYSNKDAAKIVEWINEKENDSDLLVFQEVTQQIADELNKLKPTYPYSAIYPRDDAFGVAIFSKTKFMHSERKDVVKSYVEYTELELENGLKIYELHTLPPVELHAMPPNMDYAEDRNQALKYVGEVVARDPAKNKVMLGDFNITPYSYYFTQLEETSGLYNSARGFKQNSGTWPNMPVAIFRLPIDQLLVSPNIWVVDKAVGPDVESDHLPVVTKLFIQ